MKRLSSADGLPYKLPMIQIGRYSLISAVTGRFRLDGGAMFGVVPRVMWTRETSPDDKNRIPLAMRTLMAVDAERDCVILVDTGAGHKWAEDEAQRFAIQPDHESISGALAFFGKTEADVTDVVVTHLHFDHNGGLTEWAHEPGGETRLRFPQARHWIHRRQWEHALAPNERDKASFLERDLAALRPEGVLTFVEGDAPDCPIEGVRWFISNGHTPGQLLPIFEGGSDEPSLLFTGDAIPTSGHLKVAWLMAYDLQPLVTIEEKKAILSMCESESMLLTFPHDPTRGGVKIDMSAGYPVVEQVLDL